MGEFRVQTVFWTWQRRSNLPPSSKLSKMSELKAPQTEATDAADHLAALHAAHSLALDELRARTDALQLQLTSERERHMRREEQLKAEIAQLREERDTERRADERRRSAATVQPSLLAAAATPPAPGLGRSSSGGDESEDTPAWLKEAVDLTAHEADAETAAWGKRAEELEKAEAEAEAHRAEAEARKAEVQVSKAEAEASKAKADASLAMAEDVQRQAARLEARVHGLVAERDSLLAVNEALLAVKGELLTEVARHAGHTNHKQKILYVAKLKEEIDHLKLQLREARGLAMALPGLDKENRPSLPPAPSPPPAGVLKAALKEGARPVSARAVAGGAKPPGAVAGAVAGARAARV
jgi:chromosome segregation ATPase